MSKEFSLLTKVGWRAQALLYKIKTAKLKLQYRISGGYHCDCCGKVIPFRGDLIQGEVNGKKMMVEQYGVKRLCAYCLYRKIEQYFEMSFLGDPDLEDGFSTIMREPCSWFPDEKYTVRGIMKYGNIVAQNLDLDVRIGQIHWNGFYASEKALRELLLFSGYYATSSLEIQSGGTVHFTDRVASIPWDSPSLKVFNGKS